MTHQMLNSVSMNCPACGNWTDGVHSLSETSEGSVHLQQFCPDCCPACVQAPPLAEGEVLPFVDPVQESLFGGDGA